MGYDLKNSKNNFRINVNAWPILLELAFHYGWNRIGTKSETIADWDGTYLTNSGAYVTSEDAVNLAVALEKALPDIPEIDNPSLSASIWGSNVMNTDYRIDKDMMTDFHNYINPPSGEDVSKLLLRFGGDIHRQKIKDFIIFCKEGEGFKIY
jgi:hypothetical protein